jgi:hypothetical protein
VMLDTSSGPQTATVPAVRLDQADPLEAQDRRVRITVGFTWALLILNTLVFFPATYSGLPLVIPIPSLIGKSITQAALPVALVLALTVNRRMKIRPNVFLVLVSLLALEAILTSISVSQAGNAYRTFRYVEFVVTLWLLSPWWGRRDLLLIRSHLVTMSVILGSVALGMLVAPRTALAQGRLEGAFWPDPPTEIAEFAAVTLGLVAVLWLGGLIAGRAAALVVLAAGTLLLLTHTRTAIVSLLSGFLVAALSLFATRVRARGIIVTAGIALFAGSLRLSHYVMAWWSRGETSYEQGNLTGRTKVWAGVLNLPRDQFQMLTGSGLGSQGYLGLPIDNSWLVAYNEQGLFAVVVCAAMLLILFATACFRARGTQRALALFLVTYCAVTSYTESGLSTPSSMLLYLVLAASILAPPFADSRLA